MFVQSTSDVIRSRASECFGCHGDAEVVDLLTHLGISAEQAEALLSDQPARLDAATLGRLAYALELHRDLFACLICTTSDETALFHLSRLRDSPNFLSEDGCAACAALREQLANLDELTAGRWRPLCLELLMHLLPAEVTLEPLENDHGGNDERADEGRELINHIVYVIFALLPADARGRVIAHAYRELADVCDGGGVTEADDAGCAGAASS